MSTDSIRLRSEYTYATVEALLENDVLRSGSYRCERAPVDVGQHTPSTSIVNCQRTVFDCGRITLTQLSKRRFRKLLFSISGAVGFILAVKMSNDINILKSYHCKRAHVDAGQCTRST